MILSADYSKSATDILAGKYSLKRQLTEQEVWQISKLYKSQRPEERQRLSTVSKRTRIIYEDIRDNDENEFKSYYQHVGGLSPTLGIKIPLRWLALERYLNLLIQKH